MEKQHPHNNDTDNGINAPQVVENSTIIAQILGYSPPNESKTTEASPKYPILSEFDPPLPEDQIAIFRKIAHALVRAAIQTTDQDEQKRVGFPEERGAAETDHD